MSHSYLERQIAWLRAREFGPDDPRTPSIASRPGTPLSFENQRHILEAQLRLLRHIELEAQRQKESRQQFWSDSENLSQKLDSTIRFIAAQYGMKPDCIAHFFAIVEGTGATVIQLDDEYRFVEINMPDHPVYISEKATLPDTEIPLLKTVASLGISY